MDRHEGVSCNHCSKVNFTGKRYKCLRCFDYDLCNICYLANVSSDGHTPKHPMQCIICKSDYGLYYGGEILTNTSIPQSLTCPFCSQMGFTDITLKEHISEKHRGVTCPVICPICASSHNGDPNYMATDLSVHLTAVHNIETRRRISFNIEEQIHPRIASITRNLHQRANMQVIPAVRNIRSVTPIPARHETSSPSTNPPADPIEELIMQISRVRRTNNDNVVSPLDHRARLQAMRAEIIQNRESVKQKLFVIQNATNVEAPEVIKPEPLASAPGYAALLPNIINRNLSEAVTEEAHNVRAEFVKELIYSSMFCNTEREEDSNN